MVSCLKPSIGELIQDPAVGTGGFLVSADHHIRNKFDKQRYISHPPRYEGMEIERGTYRLCLMNIFLHRMEASIYSGDTLTNDVNVLSKADVILANPPFGTRSAGARAGRGDLSHTSSNRQLQFLQHIYRGLKPGGRAAVVLPDNVMFEGGQARRVREELMELCNLHTILKLPTGIFYAQNVSTHVLFFSRAGQGSQKTEDVWVYDLRTKMPRFGKKTPLTASVFRNFVESYGASPTGDSVRLEDGSEGRFRRFTREQVRDHSDELALGWLDEGASNSAAFEPEALALQMIDGLDWVTRELRSLLDELAAGTDRRELK
jgi:type I restriction enzyme M protein